MSSQTGAFMFSAVDFSDRLSDRGAFGTRVRSLAFVAATGLAVLMMLMALVAIPPTPAAAELLVYEGFDYSAGSNLNGQTGGTGFGASSSWTASATNGGFAQIQPYNTLSGVILNDGATPNPFTGVYANLSRTGNYFGVNDGGTLAFALPPGMADHIFINRTLAPSVTATFTNGTKTYFSFVSARGYNNNPSAPRLGIGSGVFSGDRGENVSPGAGNTNSEVIAVGGVSTSTGGSTSSTLNPVGTLNGGTVTTFSSNAFFRAQYYNTAGVRQGWSRVVGTVGNGIQGQDLVGAPLTSSFGTGPAAGNNGYWSGGGLNASPNTTPGTSDGQGTPSGSGFAVYGYTGSVSSVNDPGGNRFEPIGNNQALVNITVGEIAWGAGAGGSDRVSFYVFHDKDPLSLAAYEAGKMTWDTGTDTSSRRSEFNYISMGGGRYFADEIRVGTTFAAVTVPEPGTVTVLLAGLAVAAAARLRGRGRRGAGSL